jgi:hypothetical protein
MHQRGSFAGLLAMCSNFGFAGARRCAAIDRRDSPSALQVQPAFCDKQTVGLSDSVEGNAKPRRQPAEGEKNVAACRGRPNSVDGSISTQFVQILFPARIWLLAQIAGPGAR